MDQSVSNSAPIARMPANTVVQISNTGSPWLRGFRCGICSAVASEPTMCCRRCGSRTAPEAFHAGGTGKVFSWTVVYRSYPGVAVPFISAIIDLDGGLTLKGTLRGVAADAVRAGLPVTVAFDDAGGAHSADGAAYLGYHFAAGAAA